MAERNSRVLVLVNRDSFPVNCAELDDLMDIMDEAGHDIEVSDVESPTAFFKEAMAATERYELVIPVTRNLFVRDRLRQEGVNLIICL